MFYTQIGFQEAVLLINRAWFDKISGWDEDFWMYYEDVNLSKKVSNLGG